MTIATVDVVSSLIGKRVVAAILISTVLVVGIAIALGVLQNNLTILNRGTLATPPDYSSEQPTSYIISRNGTFFLAINSQSQVEFSGIDATTVIQSAIDALGNRGGGKILLKAGVYDLTTYLDFKTYDYISFQGESWSTVLRTNNGPYNALFFKGEVSNPCYGILVSDLRIEGGSDAHSDVYNEKNGVMAVNTRNSTFERLFITGMGRTGIYNTGGSHGNYIANNILWKNQRYGLSYTSSSRGRVIGNYLYGNGYAGLNWDATYGENYYTVIQGNIFENQTGSLDLYVIGDESNRPMYGSIVGNQFFSSTGTQLKIEFGRNIVVSGNYFRRYGTVGSSRNIFVAEGGENIVIDSNVIQGVAYYAIEVSTGDSVQISNNIITRDPGSAFCIRIAGADADKAIGNRILDNVMKGPANGIWFDLNQSNILNTHVEGNDFSGLTGSAKITNFGTNSIIKNNAGFVTENSGSVTLINANSVTFNHGLAGTPTSVLASFSAPGWGDWYWTATSTQITIATSNPVTGTCFWSAEYKP